MMIVIFHVLDELLFTGMHRACNRDIVFFQLFNTQTKLEGKCVWVMWSMHYHLHCSETSINVFKLLLNTMIFFKCKHGIYTHVTSVKLLKMLIRIYESPASQGVHRV